MVSCTVQHSAALALRQWPGGLCTSSPLSCFYSMPLPVSPTLDNEGAVCEFLLLPLFLGIWAKVNAEAGDKFRCWNLIVHPYFSNPAWLPSLSHHHCSSHHTIFNLLDFLSIQCELPKHQQLASFLCKATCFKTTCRDMKCFIFWGSLLHLWTSLIVIMLFLNFHVKPKFILHPSGTSTHWFNHALHSQSK